MRILLCAIASILAPIVGGAGAFGVESHHCHQPWKRRRHGGHAHFAFVPAVSQSRNAPRRCVRSYLLPAPVSSKAECPRVMSMTLAARPKPSEDEMEQRKAELRELLMATEDEIDKLVRPNPSILSRSSIKGNYAPKLALLQDRLGVSQKAAGRLFINSKRCLGCSLRTLESKIDWLEANLNLSKKQLRGILETDLQILSLSVDDNLKPTIDAIQTSLDLSDEELTKLVLRQPQVLQKVTAQVLPPRLSFLEKIYGLKEGDIKDLRKYVMRCPQLLRWGEDSIMESYHWMQQRLGVDGARTAQMCRNHPELLYANATTLDEKANWYQDELSLEDDELAKILSSYPPMLTYSIEKKIRPKLRYLRKRFELNDADLKDLVLIYPNVATGYSVEKNIEPKLEFYAKLVGEKRAVALVSGNMALLTNASLKTRLKPRLKEIIRRGETVEWDGTLLKRLATRTPEQWAQYKLGDAKRGPKKN